jgi:hypothetical protein
MLSAERSPVSISRLKANVILARGPGEIAVYSGVFEPYTQETSPLAVKR